MSKNRTPSQYFCASTVGIVDWDGNSGNLLVRGNLPLADQTEPDGYSYFAYDDLNLAIQNLNPPISDFELSNYYLLVISLLDDVHDSNRIDWENELHDFGVDHHKFPKLDWPPFSTLPNWNPQTIYGTSVITASGSYPAGLVWWPIEAGGSATEQIVTPGFDFAGLVDYSRQLLTTPPPTGSPSSVIYFHCDSGINRTGALNVGYYLKYGNWKHSRWTHSEEMTLKEAYTNADKLVGGTAPSSTYQALLQVYCNYIETGSLTGNSPKCTYQPGS